MLSYFKEDICLMLKEEYFKYMSKNMTIAMEGSSSVNNDVPTKLFLNEWQKKVSWLLLQY